MNAIFRVDGKVSHQSKCGGPVGPEHAARFAAGGVGGLGGGGHTDAGADADRARDRRPDASRPGRAADDRERSVARGTKIKLCAVRLLANEVVVVGATVLKIKMQANELPPEAEILPVEVAGARASRGSSPRIFPRARSWPAFRCAPPAAGSACPVPARSGIASIGRSSRARRSRRRCGRSSPRISATAPRRCWISGSGRFSTPDLTVNFARQPVGEWILLDAESWIGPDGAGLAMARLADERGYFGRAIQNSA